VLKLKPIRLFIVDPSFENPDPGYWQAALHAIRDYGGIVVTGCAASLEEALAGRRRPDVDVFVVDLSRPAPDTGTLLDALSVDATSETPVIGLCEVVDETQLALSIGVGVKACVGRNSPEGLVASVVEVARGGAPIQRDLAGKPSLVWNLALDLRKRFRGTPGAATVVGPDRGQISGPLELPGVECPISAREVSILELVADGFSYREIGEVLAIAERTVKNHMARSLEKLGARGRAHAVRMALQAGWICNGSGNGSVELRAAA